MRWTIGIIWLVLHAFPTTVLAKDSEKVVFDFFGDKVELQIGDSFIQPFHEQPTQESVQHFYNNLNNADYKPLIKQLLAFKQEHQLNDWIFYQLVRKTAQQIAPKADNYYRYTLYKWFLLNKSGYDATLAVSNGQLRFYVQSDEIIYDIPYYMNKGKQYVCLNIHDYAGTVYDSETFSRIDIAIPEGYKAFSYKVTQLPDFKPDDYITKDIHFDYGREAYHFKIKLNKEVQVLFKNYPVVDYASYFNIPLSRETYGTLIPVLKKNTEGMRQKNGVDFLMRFTRNAFLYETDSVAYGKEKRLTPEQTLLNTYSDCDDRAALFFYLVKEIYNLPMIVLLYPTHVTIAVKFDKPIGNTIEYKGHKYSVCEPTPQSYDLNIGQLSPDLRKTPYEIAYAYEPGLK